MREALDAAIAWLKQETGYGVLFDPQPIRSAEPHLRLTFTGATDRGSGYVSLAFQLSIVGAGDGPEIFLEEIILASAAVAQLYGRCPPYVDLELKKGSARLDFPAVQNMTGTFTPNDGMMGETMQWAYAYVEPHFVTMTLKRPKRAMEGSNEISIN